MMSLIEINKTKEGKSEPLPGTLYLVGTPIGNLGDLSPRAKSILKNVSLIACEDTRRSGQLLKKIDSKIPLISYHKHNIKSRSPQILKILKESGSVALISDAGLPGISDPGEELVRSARSSNHKVVCIPGPCAATTALVISGLTSHRFCFEGFLPKKQSARRKILTHISKEERTTIIYESPHQIVNLLKELSSLCGEDRPIHIARELTKIFEESIGQTIKEALEYFEINSPKGEFTIVLGGNTNYKKDTRMNKLEVINKIKCLIDKGHKPKEAARIISEETGYSKNLLYSELHKYND
tara:strand:+ start:293 stop:1183 length:891 start_codon:yes stop_codon:yes gene_type:complete